MSYSDRLIGHGASAPGALAGGLELRLNASSVGLLAVRVAVAAARHREGLPLTERDLGAVRAVCADLRGEARVLRGEVSPELEGELAYAFASLALSAIEVDNVGVPDSDDIAAGRLQGLVDQLESLAGGESVSDLDLRDIEAIFLRAGDLASESLALTGETADEI